MKLSLEAADMPYYTKNPNKYIGQLLESTKNYHLLNTKPTYKNITVFQYTN